MFADDRNTHGVLIDPMPLHCPRGRNKSKRNAKSYLEESDTTTTTCTHQQPADVMTPFAPEMSSAALHIPSQMTQGDPHILAFQLSAHLSFQTPLDVQAIPLLPIFHCTPMQVPPPPQPFGFWPALQQQAPAPSWNAVMLPNAYEVVVTPAKVQKCYGCGNDFSRVYQKPPVNIIIKQQC